MFECWDYCPNIVDVVNSRCQQGAISGSCQESQWDYDVGSKGGS
jgi:hypothetical protein